MSRIKIKNFGPIKEGLQNDDGWIDIKKVTVFIGNQGSGKSTVAKLISTFTWIEKVLVRGDYNANWFERKNKLTNQYFTYHRIENYVRNNGADKTVIEYDGDAYHIMYVNGNVHVSKQETNSFSLPQIMYAPAERNFIAYVRTPKELRLTSDSLKEFLTEYDNAKNEIKGTIKLPVNNTEVEYDKLNDTLNVKGKDYKVKLTDASSGFQSLIPLYLVSDYLAHSIKKQSEMETQPMSRDELDRFITGAEEILNNDSLTEELRRAAMSVLSAKFIKKSFINIVEEPEQNLFPSSQWHILESLLQLNNMNAGNKLIITTHSPYIINFLSIAIQGDTVKNKMNDAKKADELLPKLNNIVKKHSLVSSQDVAVYEMNEADGTIKELPVFEGIPSDKNYLNNMIKEGNHLFDSLLEIEEEIEA